ncbi:inositol phosphate phosphatase SopB [Comamonas endophytica]|uniref:inositol phosphate phosphatase SopB n=1 Tax=Comamonas endophytica TaxID=2949090 RepID=UPI003623E2C2
MKPELGRTASYRGRGINSHDTTEYHHGVNVAQTRLLDGQGQVLFSGMRHGVISAFGINQDAVRHMSDQELAPMVKALLPEHLWTSTNHPVPNLTGALEAVRQDSRLVDTMRANANHNRARDTVLSTLLADSALAQRAFSGGAVALDILSISLLTPDNVRPLVSDASKNERQMMREQMQAWDSVKGEQSFLVADGTGRMRTIKVNVNPVACNYGVNAGAVGSASWLVGGWDNVEGINGKAIGELLGGDIASLATTGMPGGLIGERMQALEEQVRTDHEELQHAVQVGDELQADKARARLRLDEPRLAQARELARQIARIHQDGSYRSAGQEPYKMPTRLAVLAEMFGLKVLFNCKSGKDRTGELDAEIKHFKLQMGLSGKVPDHERTRSAAEIAQFHEVVTQSGNFEMQRLNTGYAGYKLKGVEALYRQFGGERKGDALTANFHGLSHLTAS